MCQKNLLPVGFAVTLQVLTGSTTAESGESDTSLWAAITSIENKRFAEFLK